MAVNFLEGLVGLLLDFVTAVFEGIMFVFKNGVLTMLALLNELILNTPYPGEQRGEPLLFTKPTGGAWPEFYELYVGTAKPYGYLLLFIAALIMMFMGIFQTFTPSGVYDVNKVKKRILTAFLLITMWWPIAVLLLAFCDALAMALAEAGAATSGTDVEGVGLTKTIHLINAENAGLGGYAYFFFMNVIYFFQFIFLLVLVAAWLMRLFALYILTPVIPIFIGLWAFKFPGLEPFERIATDVLEKYVKWAFLSVPGGLIIGLTNSLISVAVNDKSCTSKVGDSVESVQKSSTCGAEGSLTTPAPGTGETAGNVLQPATDSAVGAIGSGAGGPHGDITFSLFFIMAIVLSIALPFIAGLGPFYLLEDKAFKKMASALTSLTGVAAGVATGGLGLAAGMASSGALGTIAEGMAESDNMFVSGAGKAGSKLFSSADEAQAAEDEANGLSRTRNAFRRFTSPGRSFIQSLRERSRTVDDGLEIAEMLGGAGLREGKRWLRGQGMMATPTGYGVFDESYFEDVEEFEDLDEEATEYLESLFYEDGDPDIDMAELALAFKAEGEDGSVDTTELMRKMMTGDEDINLSEGVDDPFAQALLDSSDEGAYEESEESTTTEGSAIGAGDSEDGEPVEATATTSGSTAEAARSASIGGSGEQDAPSYLKNPAVQEFMREQYQMEEGDDGSQKLVYPGSDGQTVSQEDVKNDFKSWVKSTVEAEEPEMDDGTYVNSAGKQGAEEPAQVLDALEMESKIKDAFSDPFAHREDPNNLVSDQNALKKAFKWAKGETTRFDKNKARGQLLAKELASRFGGGGGEGDGGDPVAALPDGVTNPPIYGSGEASTDDRRPGGGGSGGDVTVDEVTVENPEINADEASLNGELNAQELAPNTGPTTDEMRQFTRAVESAGNRLWQATSQGQQADVTQTVEVEADAAIQEFEQSVEQMERRAANGELLAGVAQNIRQETQRGVEQGMRNNNPQSNRGDIHMNVTNNTTVNDQTSGGGSISGNDLKRAAGFLAHPDQGGSDDAFRSFRSRFGGKDSVSEDNLRDWASDTDSVRQEDVDKFLRGLNSAADDE